MQYSSSGIHSSGSRFVSKNRPLDESYPISLRPLVMVDPSSGPSTNRGPVDGVREDFKSEVLENVGANASDPAKKNASAIANLDIFTDMTSGGVILFSCFVNGAR